MIFSVYSIRDVLTGFMTPVLEQNDAVAMRNFSLACSTQAKDSSLMRFRPADYSLYRIAQFNSEDGSIRSLDPIELVCTGDSVVGGDAK